MIRILLSVSMITLSAFADNFTADVQSAIHHFKKKDPSITTFLDKSYGYAVLPNVGKGGFIVGGAHGNGLVYQGGKVVGKCEMAQATIGFQAGGQEFSEIVFFEDKNAFDHFKMGEFSVSAQVSAVVSAEGAAAKAKYKQGIAVFVLPKAGLMAEASVGGQGFKFESLAKK
jgi:lipid-binding SYLF domain-containing protein